MQHIIYELYNIIYMIYWICLVNKQLNFNNVYSFQMQQQPGIWSITLILVCVVHLRLPVKWKTMLTWMCPYCVTTRSDVIEHFAEKGFKWHIRVLLQDRLARLTRFCMRKIFEGGINNQCAVLHLETFGLWHASPGITAHKRRYPQQDETNAIYGQKYCTSHL